MQSLVVAGRILSRTIFNGIQSVSNSTDAQTSKKRDSRLLTAVSGFPKDFKAKLRKCQFGDDAWFAARHKCVNVIGVADGVGGWRSYGIDPGEFSGSLMKACEGLVKSGKFSANHPVFLLEKAYSELREIKQQVFGGSTACLLILNDLDDNIYTANIGDSGFLLIRDGEIVHKSNEQQHYFNTPFQLSLVPPDQNGQVLSDRPQSADVTTFPVKDGDVILLATDGLFDNVPLSLLLGELKRLQVDGIGDLTQLQKTANTIALMARTLAFDDRFMSPFAVNARENGINVIGGKPDDITVLLARVSL